MDSENQVQTTDRHDATDSTAKQRRKSTEVSLGIFRALNIDQQKATNQYQKDLAELKWCYDDTIKQQEQNHIAHLRNIKKLHDTELAKQHEEVERPLTVHEKLLQIPGDVEGYNKSYLMTCLAR